MTPIDRPGPFTAKGCIIHDADGNAVGGTSRPELSAALVEAYNAVNRFNVACDVCGCITVRDGDAFRCINCGNCLGANE